LYGYSPFREVQLFIDGNLAGVAWPFPIIFTGGVVPGLWRPIGGIDAFDLKEDEIDITPWLPLLCDGNTHNFTIRVSGLNDCGNGTATLSETTDTYWLVTGKAFIWLDSEGHVTTGSGPYTVAPTSNFQVSSSISTCANGTNETLYYQVSAQRSLSFKSTINLSTGNETAKWSQTLSYTSNSSYTDQGNVSVNSQQTTGYDMSSSGYARHISYPLYAYQAVSTPEGNLSIVATIQRGKDVDTVGQPVFPTGLESFSAASEVHDTYTKFQGASLSTSQSGNATYLANQTSSTSFSFGTTEQDMIFSGIQVSQDQGYFPAVTASDELFKRHVLAVNATVVQDQETLIGSTIEHAHGPELPDNDKNYAVSHVPGRGGHWHALKRRKRHEGPLH
jgi:hypothetical protein